MYKFNVYFFNHSKKSAKALINAIYKSTGSDLIPSQMSPRFYLSAITHHIEGKIADNVREFGFTERTFNIIKFKELVPDDCIWQITDPSGRVIAQSKDQLPKQLVDPMDEHAIKYSEQATTAIKGLATQVKFSTARNAFLEKSCEAFLKEKVEWMKENEELLAENNKLTKLANELTQKNARLSKRLMLIEKAILAKDENDLSNIKESNE